VEKLRQLAAMGRTIVTTIHQPSTDIFFKFDRLILLADGHMVYNGPTKDVVAYFAKLGYTCPQYTNPSEYISAYLSPFSFSFFFVIYFLMRIVFVLIIFIYLYILVAQ